MSIVTQLSDALKKKFKQISLISDPTPLSLAAPLSITQLLAGAIGSKLSKLTHTTPSENSPTTIDKQISLISDPTPLSLAAPLSITQLLAGAIGSKLSKLTHTTPSENSPTTIDKQIQPPNNLNILKDAIGQNLSNILKMKTLTLAKIKTKLRPITPKNPVKPGEEDLNVLTTGDRDNVKLLSDKIKTNLKKILQNISPIQENNAVEPDRPGETEVNNNKSSDNKNTNDKKKSPVINESTGVFITTISSINEPTINDYPFPGIG